MDKRPYNITTDRPEPNQRVMVWSFLRKRWEFAYHLRGNLGSKFCSDDYSRNILATFWLPEPPPVGSIADYFREED